MLNFSTKKRFPFFKAFFTLSLLLEYFKNLFIVFSTILFNNLFDSYHLLAEECGVKRHFP